MHGNFILGLIGVVFGFGMILNKLQDHDRDKVANIAGIGILAVSVFFI